MTTRKVLAAALGIGVFWQLSSWLVNDSILPGPLLVLQTFFIEIGKELGLHFLTSLWRVVASMLLSVALAAPAGLVLGQSKRLNEFFSPPQILFDLAHVLAEFLHLSYRALHSTGQQNLQFCQQIPV